MGLSEKLMDIARKNDDVLDTVLDNLRRVF